jgi:hypothetical protein
VRGGLTIATGAASQPAAQGSPALFASADITQTGNTTRIQNTALLAPRSPVALWHCGTRAIVAPPRQHTPYIHRNHLQSQYRHARLFGR